MIRSTLSTLGTLGALLVMSLVLLALVLAGDLKETFREGWED